MKNNERYTKQVGLLSNSGCGVILTRTREPYRAIEALREFAFDSNLPFSQWDIVNGWETRLPTDSPDADPKQVIQPEVFAALRMIEKDIASQHPASFKDKGVFVMHAVHVWLGKHPAMTECLRQYVRSFAEKTSIRLILVVPETTSLPDELQHDIPIVDFDLPNQEEVSEIFDYILESSTQVGQDVPEMFNDSEKESVLASAGGMTQMQIELAYSKAIVENRPEDGPWHDIPYGVFNGSVLESKTEVVKQSEVLELMEPVDMSDVGGLDVLKAWITEASACFSQEAIDFGCAPPAGIAAIGPPGTGKTLFGKATATQLGQPLVKFDVSKCFGKYVGESEGKVRAALKQLEAMGQVTVLFDEIDKSLGGAHQSGGDSGVSKRVLGSILTFMQETDAPIFPIYTANRVDSLPPELLRKGRLDEVFAVMPPNQVEREAILRIHLRKSKQDPEIDLEEAINASAGYVSSELEAAVKEATKKAFVRKVDVSDELIAGELGEMKPISEAFPEDFQQMEEWAMNNARLASTPVEATVTKEKPSEAVRRRRRGVKS